MRSLSEFRGVDQSSLATDPGGTLISKRITLRPRAHWQPGADLADCVEHIVYIISGDVEALSYGRWLSLPAQHAARIQGPPAAIWRNAARDVAEILWVGRKP